MPEMIPIGRFHKRGKYGHSNFDTVKTNANTHFYLNELEKLLLILKDYNIRLRFLNMISNSRIGARAILDIEQVCRENCPNVM